MFFFGDGGLPPAETKRAKSTEKTGCTTRGPLLIDACTIARLTHFCNRFGVKNRFQIAFSAIIANERLIKIYCARQTRRFDILVYAVHAAHLLRAVDHRSKADAVVADRLIVLCVGRAGHDVRTPGEAGKDLGNCIGHTPPRLAVNVRRGGIVACRENLRFETEFFRALFDKRKALIHALVRDGIERFWQEAEARGEACAAAEIPLYYECGWHAGAFSPQPVAVAIRCPRSRRFARLEATRGWDREKSALIESWQWSAERKETLADLILDNSGDLAALDHAVNDLTALLAERRAREEAALISRIAALCACDGDPWEENA